MATDKNEYDVNTEEGLTKIEAALDKRLGDYDKERGEIFQKFEFHSFQPQALHPYLNKLKSDLEEKGELNDGFDFPTITEKVNDKITDLETTSTNKTTEKNKLNRWFRKNTIQSLEKDINNLASRKERLEKIQKNISILTPIYNNSLPETNKGGKRKTRKRKSTTKRRKTRSKSKRKHSKKRKLHRK